MTKSDSERTPIFSDSHESIEPPAASSKWPLLILLGTIGATLVVFFVVIGMTGPPRSGRRAKSPSERLDNVTFQPLTADRALQSEDLAGKVTLVNFWGPWCFPCRMEFPELIQIRQQHLNSGKFVFVSVSCPSEEGVEPLDSLRADTRSFLKEVNADFPVYHDEGIGVRRAVIKTLQLESWSYPTTIVLDRNAFVRGLWVGYVPGDSKDIASVIQELMAE